MTKRKGETRKERKNERRDRKKRTAGLYVKSRQ